MWGRLSREQVSRVEQPGLEQGTWGSTMGMGTGKVKLPGQQPFGFARAPSLPYGPIATSSPAGHLGRSLPALLCLHPPHAPRLPAPALPDGGRIWRDVISGVLRDACLGLTLIIPS